MTLFFFFIKTYFVRLRRFTFFLFDKEIYSRSFWLLEWIMLLFDLLALPEILQVMFRIVNWHQRPLHSRERQLAVPVFKDSLEWSIIRLNPGSWVCKKYKFAFVSFHTIHYHDKLSDDILIHELVHVWQYQKYGSAYIVRALVSQKSEMGYNYGGILALYEKENLDDFNFEQMAEVIRDGYLKSRHSPIYDKYMKQLYE